MALNDFQIGLIASLDGTKSKHQLNQDIEALKKQLNNVEIQAKLGKDVVANLTKQLNATQISLQNVSIDKNAINNMISQINTALGNININIGANAFNNNGINQTAQNLGRQVGNLISKEVENSLKDVTSKEIGLSFRVDKTDSDEFNNAVDSEIRKLQQAKNKMVSVNYTTDTKQSVNELTGEYEHVEKLTGAVFRYNTETGEAITKTMKWAQIGTTVDDKGNDVPLMGWVQGLTRYNKALDESATKVENFSDKQSRAVTKAKNTLSSIQSEYNDKNASKPIKDISNITNLDNQVKEVETAISNLGNANKTTFTDMQNEVDTQISRLRDMVKEYRNAENVSTKLKGTDFKSGLDIARNDLEKFREDAKDFPKIKQTIEKLDKAISSVGDASSLNSFNDQLRVARSELAKVKSEVASKNRSDKVGINVSGLESKISELEKISPEISNFKTQIAGADVSVQSLKDDLVDIKTQGDFSVVNAKFKAFTDAAQAAGYAVKELSVNTKNIDNIKLSLNNGAFSTQIEKLKSNFQKFGLSAKEAENKVKELRTTLFTMQSSSGDKLVSNFQTWENQIKDVKVQLDQAKLSFDKFEQPASDEKIASLLLRIQNFLSKNTAITKEAKTQLELYLNELNGGVTLGRWNQMNQTLAKTESEMRTLGKLGLTFKDQWNQAIGSFSTWLSASTAVMFFVSKAKDAVKELKDIDTYLTEISKSNDKLTESQLKSIGADSFDTASKYGKKVTDYLSGVQEASRAGYENAEAIAELSTAAQGAGDMNADLANSYIIATDKAYAMDGSIEELTKTLDGSNNITNHNAVNMTELAEGMKVVGSQAASSQISIEETTAAIGTLVAVTQQSGSEMGNAFKGILMNLRQVTGEVNDGGDAIDEKSLTKYEKACEQLGVSLTTVKDGVVSLKEPMQILKELSKEYTKLDESDAKRANLLSAVGGKYRANALNAILENYDTYEKMLKDYEDGEGSMAEEAEKTANSWEGSLNRLSNTFNDTVGNIVNSDFVIKVVNLLNNVLSLINKTTSALGSWGTIGVGVGITAFVKNFD